MVSKNTEYFFWYDLETTGTDPMRDRIMQFAAIRTDLNLNQVGDTFKRSLRLPDEVIPHPDACCITGLDPLKLNELGCSELECLHEAQSLLMHGGTCICGFNNANFDDNFLRYGFYRNLYPAYQHEFNDGNSRLDLLPILRFAAALRPDGINWPVRDGKQSFQLEALAAANGFQTDDAHDALADVRNTLAMAKLLKSNQPRLWKYIYDHRRKRQVEALIRPFGERAFLFTSSRRSDSHGYLGVGVAITTHEYDNNVLGVDLTQAVSLLGSVTTEELRAITFASQEEREKNDWPTSPIFRMRLNRCPVVSPINALTPADAKRLGISQSELDTNLQYVRGVDNLQTLLRDVYSREGPNTTSNEPEKPRIAEEQLYGSDFVANRDLALGKRLRGEIHANHPSTVAFNRFAESRTQELATRLVARNSPDRLEPQQQQEYDEFVRSQLTDSERGVHARLQQVNEARQRFIDPQHSELLNNLQVHIKQLQSKYAI